MAEAAVVPCAGAGEPAGSSGAALGDAAARARRRLPTAWLRRLVKGAQAVAEERRDDRAAGAGPDDDDASDDGGAELESCASFGSLPEHLLEKVFLHLRGANRRHHFAM